MPMVIVPYVKGLSERSSKFWKPTWLAQQWNLVFTLWNILVHPKGKICNEKKSEVMYKIPCRNCERVYIGETENLLGIRVKEHRKKWNALQEYSLQRKRQGSKHNQQVLRHGLCAVRQCQDDWPGIMQDWQTHKRGSMDQKEQQYESRWALELPTCPVWHLKPKPEVGHDEGHRSATEILMKETCFVCVELTVAVFECWLLLAVDYQHYKDHHHRLLLDVICVSFMWLFIEYAVRFVW